MVDTPAVPAVTEPDPFAAAFDNLSKLGDKPIPANLLDPPPVIKQEGGAADPGHQPAAAAPAPEPKPGDTPTPGEDSGIVPVPPDDQAAAADAARIAAEAAKPQPQPLLDDSFVRRLAEVVNRTPDPQDQAVNQQPAPRPLMTAQEMAVIQDFEKQWPEQAAAQAILMRAQANRLVDHILGEVARMIQPVMDTTGQLAFDGHLSELEQAIPDYHDVRDQVIAWAQDKSQPEYLRNAYERVIAEGSASEIKDLTDRWRAATGTAQAAQVAPTPAAPAKDAGLSPAARQAAARLAPIASKVAATPVGAPSTFEDAFTSFANADL